jgi:hypothetical protein
MLFAVNLHKNFVDVERIAIALMLSLQSTSINRSEFDTPEADRFSADSDASLGQKVFDIPVTEIEAVVEPDGVGDDIGREAVPFICVHGPILPISAA